MTWSLSMSGSGNQGSDDRIAREKARKLVEDLRAAGHQVGFAQLSDVDGMHNLLEAAPPAPPKEG